MSEAPLDRLHANITLTILGTAGLAYALMQTMVVPALPSLQRDLHTTNTWATWLLTVFLLTGSVAAPILGKLGDQYGKERLLVISLALFLIGCIGAAAAWNIWSLIAWRAVQGTGSAIFPLAFSIIRDEFPTEKVGVAIGTISAVFGVGGGLGIVLSGVLIDQLSWRWLFIVGALPVAIALVLVHRFVPESPIKQRTSVDFLGAALLSGGLISLLLGLTEGERWGWGSARIVGLFAASAALLLAWGLAELRVPDPMVDMRMLARRPVLLTNVTALIAGFSMFGFFVLVPAFAQTPRGLTPQVARLVHYGFNATTLKAGLYLLPGSILMLFSGPIAGLLGRRFGSKWPLAFGMALIALAAALLARWHARPWHVILAMFVLSGGVSFAFASMATLVTEAVKATETGVATGLNTVMRTVGGVVGGQLGAVMLATRTIPGTRVASVSAFTTTFWICGAAACVGVVSSILIASRGPRRTEELVAAEATAGD
jgi:EmrB/QacA subfamily drug resistance transporter